jgi:hypothetical protein
MSSCPCGEQSGVEAMVGDILREARSSSREADSDPDDPPPATPTY